MERWGIPAAALLLFFGLCWHSASVAPRAIEQDLTERATAALQAGGIEVPPGAVRFEGQDATLTGPAGAAIVGDEARRRVEAVWGVSGATLNPMGNPASVNVPPPPPPRPTVTATATVAAEAAKVETEIGKLLEGKTVEFAPNSDVLLPAGRSLLDTIAKVLSASPDVAVAIAGYTDSDGDARRNLTLSKRRAGTVKRYLMLRGIAAKRLTDQGCGAADPVAPNDTAEGRARNRRIEFHASKGQ